MTRERRTLKIGDRKNMLVALSLSKRNNGKYYADFRCDCGTIKSIVVQRFMDDHTRSCGCLRKTIRASGSWCRTHGMCGTTEYKSWSNMISRCYNSNSVGFKNYGGRGISVCARWDDSFEAFLDDMGKKPGPDYSIDRIDVNRGYSKDNCKWSTRIEQMNNTTRNREISFAGKKQGLALWCNELNLNYGSINSRLHRGWSATRALTTPLSAPFSSK